MAVSKAIVPLLRDEEVESFMRTLKSSKMKTYTEEESKETDRKVAAVLSERMKK